MTQITQEWAHLVIRRSHRTAQCPRGVRPEGTAFSSPSVSVSGHCCGKCGTISDRPGGGCHRSGLSVSCHNPITTAATIATTHSQKERGDHHLFSWMFVQMDVCADGLEASGEDLSFGLHEICVSGGHSEVQGGFESLG